MSASAEGSYLATLGDWQEETGKEALLYHFRSINEAIRIDVPAELSFQTVRAAPDPMGVLHLALEATDFTTSYEFVRVEAGEFTVETLSEGEGPELRYLNTFAFDSQGRAHVWIDQPWHNQEGIRSAAGEWTWTELTHPWEEERMQVGLRQDGISYLAAAIDTSGGVAETWELQLWDGAESRPLGTGEASNYQGDSWRHLLWPTLPETEDLTNSTRDLVLERRHDRLQLRWSDGVEQGNLDLFDVQLFADQCITDVRPTDEVCPAHCEEKGGGVQMNMADIVRTSDGRYWVAWVVTQLDRVICAEYYGEYDHGFSEWCEFSRVSDASTAEFVFAELDIEDATLQERFRITTGVPTPSGNSLEGEAWASSNYQALDMSVYGAQVTVGLRLDPLHSYARVLQVDTSMLD